MGKNVECMHAWLLTQSTAHLHLLSLLPLILHSQLLQNPKVLFAGYKVAHPLEHQFILKVQTTPDTTPLEVLKLEIDNLIAKYSDIRRKVRRIYLKIRDRGVRGAFHLEKQFLF